MNSLDTVISFAVVMVALSALLQMMDNAISNALKLRWKNYAQLVGKMYQELLQVDQLNSAAFQNTLRQSWKDKNGAIISFRDRISGFHDKVAALHHDMDGLYKKLNQIATTLAASDTIDKKAWLKKHLRDEFQQVQNMLDEIRDFNLSNLFTIYNKAAEAIGSPREKGKGITKLDQETMNKLIDQVDELQTKLINYFSDAAVAEFEKQLNELIQTLNGYKKQLKTLITQIEKNTDDLLVDLEDEYNKKTVIYNFIMAIILCFALNADSFLIYEELSANPELRQSFVDKALNQINVSLVNEDAQLNRIGEQLNDIDTNVDRASLTQTHAEMQTWLKRMQQQAISFNQAFALNPSSALVFDADSAKAKLKEADQHQSENASNDDTSEYTALLNDAYDELNISFVRFNLDIARVQTDALSKSGLPIGWTKPRFEALREQMYCINLAAVFYKIMGLLFTAILISFGSGFWNKLLEALLGVRGVLRKPTQKMAGAPNPGTNTTTN